ncbi:hypothetical protein B0T18DRAFT_384978 [Schizothecium vesticola]|uniref:Uncharacterized protein n=1 Tax=Schizothecium vesticola TaxID=314040 RepID=A0AA40F7V1_9PEZI|nr:hypothetical protein B0T18DRAFT_384978 [Schizothecium vesticola]
MAEIFGLVTGAVQTLAAVDRAVAIFGRLQNAPKQIRLVRILLAQIEHDLVVLKQSYGNSNEEAGGIDNHQTAGRQIPPATIAEIEASLNECRIFVNKYNDVFSDKASRGRIFWSSVKHTAKLATAAASAAGAGATLNGIRAPISEYSQRQDEVRQVQQELNAALTINLRDVLETGAVEVDADLKNLRGATLTLQGEDVPPEYRTLFLDGLQLATRDEMTTMLRFSCNDKSIRVQHLVQFSTPPYLSSITSPDVLFRATHPITLLLQDGNHLLHVAHPHYHFSNVSTRRKFQELVRARTFVAEMVAVEVFPLFSSGGSADDGSGGLARCSTGGTTSTSSKTTSTTSSSSRSSSSTFSWRSIIGKKMDRHEKRKQEMQCLARSEPLQIWQLPGCGIPNPGAMTVTFVADAEQLVRKWGGGGVVARGVRDQWRVLEWHAGDLAVGGAPQVVVGERSSAPWAVEMWWAIQCVGAAPGVRITFRSKSEAKRFAKLFKPPDWGAAREVLGAVGRAQVGQSYMSFLDPVVGLGSIESEMFEVMGTQQLLEVR